MAEFHHVLVVAVFCFLVIPISSQPFATWYKLSLQWRPAVCFSTRTTSPRPNTLHCNPPPQNPVSLFTIRGLWGQDGRGRVNCPLPYQTFRGHLRTELELDLNKYWPHFYVNASPDAFWEYEYGLHGACLFNRDHELYFQTGMALRQKLVSKLGMEVEAFLDSAGIHPGKSYTGSQFLDAFQTMLNIMPQLDCNTSPIPGPNGEKVKQLSELHFCVDAQTWEFVNCTASLGPEAASNYLKCTLSDIVYRQ